MPLDNDTRLLFATSFDGPWESYMVDFASTPLKLFDAIFQYAEGYEGLTDVYAFPSPENPGRLVCRQHTPVHPTRRSFLRRADLPLPDPAAHAAERPGRVRALRVGAEEFVFDCVFSAPRPRGRTGASRGRPPAATACAPAPRTLRERPARGTGVEPARTHGNNAVEVTYVDVR